MRRSRAKHSHPKAPRMPWAVRLLRWLSPPEFADDLAHEVEIEVARRRSQGGLGARISAALWCWGELFAPDLWKGRSMRSSWFASDGSGWLETCTQDLGGAIRSLARNPAFSATVVLILALGLGTSFTIFTLYKSILSDDLAFPDAHRLTAIQAVWPQQGVVAGVPGGDLFDYREQSRSFSAFGAIGAWYSRTLVAEGEPAEIRVRRVTPGLFALLGVPLVLGKEFEESLGEGDSQILLSESLWERVFSRSPRVLGSLISLRGVPTRIIGVVSDRAQLGLPLDSPGGAVAAWEPLMPSRNSRSVRPQNWSLTLGRLRDEATLESARQEMDAIASGQRQQFRHHGEVDQHLRLVPLPQFIAGDARPTLQLLAAAAVLILCLSCASVATLVISQASNRRPEFALRHALGGSIGRLVRQRLAELAILAPCGALGGLFFAWSLVTVLLKGDLQGLPRSQGIGIDVSVLFFAFLATSLTVLLSGLLPALKSGLVAPRTVLGSSPGGRGRVPGQRSRRLMVTLQIAFALPLLFATVLLGETLLRIQSTSLGFEPNNVVTFDLRTPRGDSERYTNGWVLTLRRLQQLAQDPGVGSQMPAPGVWASLGSNQLMRQIEEALSALPGVERVGYAWSRFGSRVSAVLRRPGTDPPTTSLVALRFASPDFFAAQGTRLMVGRGFDDRDGVASAIVDESFLAANDLRRNPLGQRLELEMFEVPLSVEIVGVAETVRQSPREQEGSGTVFLPARAFSADGAAFSVRTRGTASAGLLSAIRDAVRKVESQMTPMNVSSLSEFLWEDRRVPRMTFRVVSGLGLIALFLSTTGLYGSISCAVRQRRREVGIRTALGARPGQIFLKFLKEGLNLSVGGLFLGILLSAAVSGILNRTLYGVDAHDPSYYILVALAVLLVSLAACLAPAVEATRVNSVVVLKGN